MSSARDFQEVSAPFETQCSFTAPLIFLTWTISIIFLILYKMALWKCIALLSLFLFFSQICSMPTKCTMRRPLVKATHNLLENMVSWVYLSLFPPCSLYFLSLPYLYVLIQCVSFLIGRSFSSRMLGRKRQNTLPWICPAIKWLPPGKNTVIPGILTPWLSKCFWGILARTWNDEDCI